MKLNELSKKCHEIAVSKGFYDEPNRNISELLMLIVSELAEAQEALRKNKHADIIMYERLKATACNDFTEIKLFEEKIKDTFFDEIADTFIRLFDLCGYLDIDIEKHIEVKMKYNETRERKHGKEF